MIGLGFSWVQRIRLQHGTSCDSCCDCTKPSPHLSSHSAVTLSVGSALKCARDSASSSAASAAAADRLHHHYYTSSGVTGNHDNYPWFWDVNWTTAKLTGRQDWRYNNGNNLGLTTTRPEAWFIICIRKTLSDSSASGINRTKLEIFILFILPIQKET